MVPPTDMNGGPCALTFRLLPSRLPDRVVCPVLISTIRGVDVVRIISPDLGEPFLSLSRLLLISPLSASSSPLTPADLLQQFHLHLPLSYDISLANLAPFDDIWVTLRTARRVARELGVERELEPLLEWGGRRAWCEVRWDERGRCILEQNWLARMGESIFAPFYKVEVPDPTSRHITVLDPAELLRLKEPTLGKRDQAFLKAWEKVTVWSSYAYEEYRENQSVRSKHKAARPATVTFEDPALPSLQEAFPPLLYESTYALEGLLSASTSLQFTLPPTNGRTNGHGPTHPASARATVQSVLELCTAHAKILLHIRTLTSTLDVPINQQGNQGLRKWLQNVPERPSPVPGMSPVPSPVGSPAPGAGPTNGIKKEEVEVGHLVTPPSSPKLGKGVELPVNGAVTPRDEAEMALMERERQRMAQMLKEMQQQLADAESRAQRLERAEGKVKELEERLSRLDDDRQESESAQPKSSLATAVSGGSFADVLAKSAAAAAARRQKKEEEDKRAEEEELPPQFREEWEVMVKEMLGPKEPEDEEDRVQEAALKVDEEDEESVLARLQGPPPPPPPPPAPPFRGRPIAPFPIRTPTGLSDKLRQSTSGRRSRSSSPESDSSTIRPSSPLQDISTPLEDDPPALALRTKASSSSGSGFGLRRLLFTWGALVALFLAIWMALVGANRAGLELADLLPLSEAAARGAFRAGTVVVAGVGTTARVAVALGVRVGQGVGHLVGAVAP